MAKPRPTFTKRQRERKKEEKKQDKARRKAERQREKEDRDEPGGEEVDPDIAHIVPGPQPLPWEQEEEDQA